MLRKGLELPRDDLRNFSKLGVRVPSFYIVPDIIGKQEKSALISLGGIGILLLLLFLLAPIVRFVIGRGRIAVHFTGVSFLVLLGEFLPFGGFFGLERFELRGEDFGNITKFDARIFILDSLTMSIRVQEEGTHVPLRLVGILVLLALLLLGLDDHFFLFGHRDFLFIGTIDLFFVRTHCGNDVSDRNYGEGGKRCFRQQWRRG
mmetsp:Transcript_20620/g.43285  ORF Transcript_20620/g.43285 Transcript_20620/m.43285 type:complete len:204 (-) Transcript_20620:212-823(-)